MEMVAGAAGTSVNERIAVAVVLPQIDFELSARALQLPLLVPVPDSGDRIFSLFAPRRAITRRVTRRSDAAPRREAVRTLIPEIEQADHQSAKMRHVAYRPAGCRH